MGKKLVYIDAILLAITSLIVDFVFLRLRFDSIRYSHYDLLQWKIIITVSFLILLFSAYRIYRHNKHKGENTLNIFLILWVLFSIYCMLNLAKWYV